LLLKQAHHPASCTGLGSRGCAITELCENLTGPRDEWQVRVDLVEGGVDGSGGQLCGRREAAGRGPRWLSMLVVHWQPGAAVDERWSL